MDLLSNLNDEQQKPVLHTEGAVMVSAGAGSGKTRVLTYRVAYLITEKGVSPRSILAITFTNKAAREMRERLEGLLDGECEGFSDMWVMTFHAMCARILRYHADRLGYTRDFTIYAEDESDRIIKGFLKSDNVNEKAEEGLKKKIKFHIGNRKNNALSIEDYLPQFNYVADIKYIGDVMERYDAALKKNNALDFDDLLFKVYELFKSCPDVLGYFRRKFRYIHIDEFQDTNLLQYELVKLMAGIGGNVLAVGDEDQSIYGWRGARFSNISDFISEMGAAVYKLELNYRSTKRILDAANSVIKNNAARLPKTLWTKNGEGSELKFYEARDEGAEAEYVARKIRDAAYGDSGAYRKTAILMRINALSRAFEEKFMLYDIPYRVYGGFKFYERKEIKDVLAYARIAVNPEDDDAVIRASGVGGRGIGTVTADTLLRYGAVENKSLYRILETIDENTDFKPSIIKKLAPFAADLKRCTECAQSQPPDIALFNIVRISGTNEQYAEDTDENLSRRMNIDELIASVQEFAKNNPDAALSDYLQNAQLLTDMDSGGDNGGVIIATIHSAKGLEFDRVFIVGMEENLFPVSRAADSPAELEEERRLLYVAITRARKELTITRSESRYLYGSRMPTLSSRFLSEIEGINAARQNRVFADDFGVSFGKMRNTFNNAQWNDNGKNKRKFGTWDEESEYNENQYKVKKEPAVPRYEPAPVLRAADIKPKDYSAYRAGMTVDHPKFGRGEILNVDSGLAEIRFKAFGNKTLSLAFAPLVIIEN